jgi:hypothetical protein
MILQKSHILFFKWLAQIVTLRSDRRLRDCNEDSVQIPSWRDRLCEMYHLLDKHIASYFSSYFVLAVM